MCVIKKVAAAATVLFVLLCKTSPEAQAALQFLPDFTDSEYGFSGNKIPDRPVPIEDCKDFPISDKCPDKGSCSKCAFGEKFKLNSCQSGYKLSDNTCIAETCDKIDPSYLKDVASGKVCSIVPGISIACYNGCRDISCAAYTLTNCPTKANCTPCPDCQTTSSTKGTCSVAWQKVASCQSATQKVNSTATACVDKSDTCATGYFKDCGANGIDTTKPTQKTEMGSTCYVCKAPATCTDYVQVNFPSYTTITSTETLQHALIDNKNNLVVTKDFNLTADVDLSGKTVMGANEIASASTLCKTNPKIIAQKQIKTNNNTEFKKLTFVNNLPNTTINNDRKCYWVEMMSGGGTFRDVEFVFTSQSQTSSSGSTYYTNNWNNPHFSVRGIANFYNIKSTGMKHFTVENGSTLNVHGNVEVNKGTSTDISGSVFSMAGEAPVLNIKSGSSVSYTGNSSMFNYDGGVGDCQLSGDQKFARNAILNIDGNVQHTLLPTEYSPHTIEWWYGTVNINMPITLQGTLYTNGSTVNINAPTIINKATTWAVLTDNGKLNINAPLTIKGFKAITDLDYAYTGSAALDVDDIYINSDLIFDTRVDFMNDISRGVVTFGSKANVRGPARWVLGQKSYSMRSVKYESGAKLELSGVCKQATSSGSFTPPTTSTTLWKNPQSPFTGSCSSSSLQDCSTRNVYRTCSGSSYRCGSDITDCGLITGGIGGCVLASTCR